MSKALKGLLNNFIHNQKKVMSLAAFSSCFGVYLIMARRNQSEAIRLGAACCLVTMLVESSFYILDSVNSKSKVNQEAISMIRMLNTVLREEGALGLVKGFSASFYGSFFYGFSYFHIYIWAKLYGYEYFNERNKLPLLYFLSAAISEVCGLTLYYPFETIKVRYQTKFHHY